MSAGPMKTTMQVTLPSDREIAMTRVLNAPRRLVFDAFTKPELIKRWLYGPEGWSMPTCDVELRAGGSMRYVWRHANGQEMGLRGVFREIVPPERIVHNEIFDEDWTGGEATVTTTFVEKDGKTTVTMTILYTSRETRDSVLKSGMEKGVGMSYDRLEAMLPSMSD